MDLVGRWVAWERGARSGGGGGGAVSGKFGFVSSAAAAAAVSKAQSAWKNGAGGFFPDTVCYEPPPF